MLFETAARSAESRGEPLTTADLLLAMAAVPGTARLVLTNRGLNEQALRKAARGAGGEPGYVLTEITHQASQIASQLKSREVAGVHLLAALTFTADSAAVRVFEDLECDPLFLRNAAFGSLTVGGLRLVNREEEVRKGGHASHASMDGGPPSPSIEARRAAACTASPHLPVQETKRRERPLSRPLGRKNETRKSERKEIRPPLLKLPVKSEARPAPKAEPPVKDHTPAKIGDFDLDPKTFPLLTSLGRNLMAAASRGDIDPLIGRQEEIGLLTDILLKRRANNPLLVGPPGVGKTAIVEGLALLSSRGEIPALQGRIIIQISAGDLLTGTQLRGALAEKIGGLRKEVEQSGGRVILFIDEIHGLLSGADASGDIVQELKSSLAQGKSPLIGTTTPAEMKQHLERDPALLRRFSVIEIPEPSEAEAEGIILGVKGEYEAHHGVSIPEESVRAAVSLTARYVTDRALPDKALSLIDLVAAGCRRDGRSRVDPEDVGRTLAKEMGVPAERLLASQQKRLMDLEGVLEKRIVGQKHVLRSVSEVLRRNAVGFRARRPIGSFLFLGPTGVGKTETAKVLAEVLFPGPGGLIRFDMSESHATARFVGSPPGYIGHEEGGQLTEAVRKRPYSLILLDEIEKAHRDVLQLLLGVLEDGRLTDGRGKTVDFTNSVIIMTSNLGDGERGRGRTMGFGAVSPAEESFAAREAVLRSARSDLPVELWNRIDEPLVFDRLTTEDAMTVGSRLLGEVAERLRIEQNVTMDILPGTLERLLRVGGYDESLGARPMRRTIQHHVEAPLASMILSGALERGDTALIGPDEDQGLSITPK